MTHQKEYIKVEIEIIIESNGNSGGEKCSNGNKESIKGLNMILDLTEGESTNVYIC